MRDLTRSVMGDRVGRVLLAAGVLAAGAVLGVSVSREASVVAAHTEDIMPIRPVRYVDTRAGETTVDGFYAGTGRVKAGEETAFKVTGRPGVPADAAGIVMNVTAVRPSAPGHITVYPCGKAMPTVSNINYEGGDVAPNAVFTKVGIDGKVCVMSVADTDLVIDVNAFVPDAGSPVALDPVRQVDTRTSSFGDNPGRLTGGKEYKFTIAGRSGVPAKASAAIMNITAVRPSAPGHVTVYPCGTTRPNVSNINYSGNDVAPNAVLSKIGTNGQICVFSVSDTDLLIDISGFVPAGGVPMSIDPVRLVDSRTGETTVDGRDQGTGRLEAGKEYRFELQGRGGLPVRMSGAMMNITAVRPDGPGHVTVYPCDSGRPNVSSINYEGGDVVPNAVFSKFSDDGSLCVFSLRATDLIIDVNAYTPMPPDVVDPSTTGPSPDSTYPDTVPDTGTPDTTIPDTTYPDSIPDTTYLDSIPDTTYLDTIPDTTYLDTVPDTTPTTPVP